MQVDALLSNYPEKSFSEKFKEKKAALVGIGAPEDQINNKEESYFKLFRFDNLVKDIHKKISDVGVADLSDIKIERVDFHFNQIKELINSLESQLNYENKDDINQIFLRFDEILRGKGFLDNIWYNAGGVDIDANESILDRNIDELELIMKELDSSNLSIEKIKEAETIINNVIKNKDNYENAAKTAKNWIKTEGVALAQSVEEKAKIFNQKADKEHCFDNTKLWLYASILSGVITLVIIYFFVKAAADNDVTIGAALLRISALVVISYFTFLFSQQFLSHRKLYEAYKFKAIALFTMEELLKSYTEPTDRKVILNKAVDNIFSEPSLKEDKLIQQKIIDGALDVITKKV